MRSTIKLSTSLETYGKRGTYDKEEVTETAEGVSRRTLHRETSTNARTSMDKLWKDDPSLAMIREVIPNFRW